MSKEAMKLALEALEFKGNIWHMDCKKDGAITAIKEALMFFQDGAQPSVSVEHSATHGEPVAWGVIASNTGKMCQVELDYDEVSDINSKWLVPLYTTPPQSKEPEQEPVAWAKRAEVWLHDLSNANFDWPYFTNGVFKGDCLELADLLKNLYTTPQQRKPLTDEQIADIVIEMNGNEPPALFWKDLTRAIEAAHGIKENT